MSVNINLYVALGIAGWLAVGAIFAWRMAISPIAVVVLVLAWPIFLVLLALAPLINYLVNRDLPKGPQL